MTPISPTQYGVPILIQRPSWMTDKILERQEDNFPQDPRFAYDGLLRRNGRDYLAFLILFHKPESPQYIPEAVYHNRQMASQIKPIIERQLAQIEARLNRAKPA